MVFNTGAALLDAIVLAVVSKDVEGTYGYKITQEVRQVIELSESTLYPVLRRLQKDECLEVYDMECAGRNRRYYKVTSRGWAQLRLYESEWRQYSDKITGLFEGRVDLTGGPGEVRMARADEEQAGIPGEVRMARADEEQAGIPEEIRPAGADQGMTDRMKEGKDGAGREGVGYE